MDDQNQPSEPGRYTPPGTLPPPVQSFPQPYSQAPQPVTPQVVTPTQPLMQWEQRVSGPVGGSVVGPAILPDPGLPVTFAQQAPRKKRGVMVGIVSLITLLILGAGGAFAYTVWNQTPEKVLADGIVNLIKAKTATYKGTLIYETKPTSTESVMKYTVTVDGKSTRLDNQVDVEATFTLNGKEKTIEGSGIFDQNSNLYFKLEKVQEILTMFLGAQSSDNAALLKALQPLIAKIDGKWIKVSADDLQSFTSSDDKQIKNCASDAVKKFAKDDAMIEEIAELYQKNTFLLIESKLGTQNGSMGYKLKADKDKAKSFVLGLNDTKILKELQKCDKKTYTLKPLTDSIDSSDSKTTESIEVWISEQKHEITKVTTASDTTTSKSSSSIEPIFGGDVSVNAPKDSTPIKEFIEEIQTAYMTYYQESFKSQSQSTQMSGMEDSTKKL